jgi:predicted membrane protein
MKDSVKIIIGVALVTIGGLLLVERLGVFLPFNVDVWQLIGMFWPLILIAIGLKLFFENNTTGGVILFTLGAVIFLTNVFDFNFFSVLWPLLIIALGVSILIRKEDSVHFNTVSSEYSEDYIKESVAFWGSEKKLTSKAFKGGELNVAFGGLTLDLREAKVHKDGAKLNVNVAFGGADIFVPKNCRIKTSGTGVLGGWDPQLKSNDVENPVLEITGTAILGGVDIKN